MKPHALFFSSRMIPFHRSNGAHRIATVLRRNGWDVEVLDFAAHIDLEKLKEFTKLRTNKNTKFFAFSSFINYWNKNIDNFTKWCKETYPDIPTILGGQSVLLTNANYIDYKVDSYGEVAMLELAKRLSGFGSSNLIVSDASKPDITKQKVIKALHEYPAWDMKEYGVFMEDRDFLEPHEWLTIEFARGCRFKCDFCNFPILGVKEDLTRDAKDFETELKYNYDKFGITNYLVADETINDRTDKLEKFGNVVKALDFKPYLSGFMRADLLVRRPQDWEHVDNLNLGGHYYGIETMNKPSAKIISKGMDPEELRSKLVDYKNMASKTMHFRGTISLIIGLPYETVDTWNATKQWLFDYWTDQSVSIFPLDLSDAKNPSDWTNVSKFSRNLMKYGIREMTGLRMEELRDRIAEDRFHYGATGETYYWEHDTMDMATAMELSDDFWGEDIYKFHFDNWDLQNACFNSGKTLEEVMPMKFKNWKDIDAKAFIERYINKKLGW